jgi:GT2 family glycosyltransferase
MVSTIILNWNRDYLLKQSVDSYLSTVGEDAELFIVDNASSDGSREFLRSLDKETRIHVLYLDKNAGGEAFNAAIPRTLGDLVHLSENDQIFLPGWFEHVVAAFAAFDDLGQLSLFADTPTDDKAWDPQAVPFAVREAKNSVPGA